MTYNNDRCNYCNAQAVVRFCYRGYLSTRPRNPWMLVKTQSCAEHEGCVNWNSIRALHSDAPIERRSQSTGRWTADTLTPAEYHTNSAAVRERLAR